MAGIIVGIMGSLLATGIEKGAEGILGEIEKGLGKKTIGDELDSIQNAVAGLQVDLARDTAEILKQLKIIKQQELYIAWEVRDTLLQKFLSQLSVQYSRLVLYGCNPKSTTKNEAAELAKEILNSNDGAEVSLNNINSLVTGSGSDKGVLELFREMTVPLVESGAMKFQDAINAYFQYYMNIAYAQCNAIYLLVEAFNFQKSNNPKAQEMFVEYRKLAYSQEIPFISNLNYFLKAGSVHNDEHTSPTISNNLALQDYLGQGLFDLGYIPTASRAKAERIFSNTLGLRKKETRIVVNMIVNTSVFKEALDMDTPIVSASKDIPVPVSPDKEDIFTLSSSPVGAISIRRMVFNNVTGDSYRLQDMNGQEGYLPWSGSHSGGKTLYFMDPKYLNHLLIVNEGSKHTSMDFQCYALENKA